MRSLLPYPVLVGKVDLEVRQARLDDVPVAFTMISTSERMVALHQVEDAEWSVATLSVRLNVPRSELDDGPWSDIECSVVLSERATNVRSSFPLTREDAGVWSGEVVLYRDRHVGRVDLVAHVIGSVGGVVGRSIGRDPDPWTVDLRAARPVKRQGVKTVWADFGAEDNPQLNPFQNDPWTVDAVGSEPKLYLNRRFEGLEALLAGGRNVDPGAREMVASQIAGDLWAVLFNAALSDVRIDENGRPEWPEGWRESTLRRMLPDVLPEYSADDALAELVARRERGENEGYLQTRVLHAASQRARLVRHLGGFLRARRRTAGEEEK